MPPGLPSIGMTSVACTWEELMSEAKPTFQELHGCSGCKHAGHKDPQGQDPHVHGKHFWCEVLAKAVDTHDGAACKTFCV